MMTRDRPIRPSCSTPAHIPRTRLVDHPKLWRRYAKDNTEKKSLTFAPLRDFLVHIPVL